jgi:hypothetical protein
MLEAIGSCVGTIRKSIASFYLGDDALFVFLYLYFLLCHFYNLVVCEIRLKKMFKLALSILQYYFVWDTDELIYLFLFI